MSSQDLVTADPKADVRARNARIVAVAGWTMIWSGVFLFGYLGWQLFGTDLVNERVQAAATETLDAHLESERQIPPTVEEVEVEDGDTVEFFPEAAPGEDQELAWMRVPVLGLEAVVFEGVTTSTLSKGPGHMPGTPLPGQPGNAVISGHRTTYGRPFYDFDRLTPGDRIEVETVLGNHVYEVRESFIVEPSDVWVVEDRTGGWLTLTTCHPKFSARERLIVVAELVEGPNLEYVKLLGDGSLGSVA